MVRSVLPLVAVWVIRTTGTSSRSRMHSARSSVISFARRPFQPPHLSHCRTVADAVSTAYRRSCSLIGRGRRCGDFGTGSFLAGSEAMRSRSAHHRKNDRTPLA